MRLLNFSNVLLFSTGDLLQTVHRMLILAWIGCVSAQFRIGMGKSDITGPIAEIPFMGYGVPGQTGLGLHLRQFCRSVVVQSESDIQILTLAESGMIGHELKTAILEEVNKNLSLTLTSKNLLLSATHTHSAPGGYLSPFLFVTSVKGIHPQSFDSIKNGCSKAIIKAYNSLDSASIFFGRNTIENVQINRSPTSYLENAKADLDKFSSNTNKEAFSLIFKRHKESDEFFGSFSWFGLHPTSMNFTNRLVSTDNRGYAAWRLEKLGLF